MVGARGLLRDCENDFETDWSFTALLQTQLGPRPNNLSSTSTSTLPLPRSSFCFPSQLCFLIQSFINLLHQAVTLNKCAGMKENKKIQRLANSSCAFMRDHYIMLLLKLWAININSRYPVLFCSKTKTVVVIGGQYESDVRMLNEYSNKYTDRESCLWHSPVDLYESLLSASFNLQSCETFSI